jgi:glycosyltransferase involved in cell wall biosynthesis
MPVVSTYTGGVPSLIDERKNGLFFPTGDSQVLASRVREIFKNDKLAINLGEKAYETAQKRHSPEIVLDQLIKSYLDVLKKHEIHKK